MHATYTLSLHDALPISCTRVGVVCPQVDRSRRLAHEPRGFVPAGGPKSEARARGSALRARRWTEVGGSCTRVRSEEHTSELQSRLQRVCRLLLEKKKIT